MYSRMKKNVERYFEILDGHFGSYYRRMIENGQNRGEIAIKSEKDYTEIAAKSECITLFEDLRTIDWDSLSEDIRKIPGVKVYSYGNEFYIENVIKKTGMYADTVVFDEPIASGVQYLWRFGKAPPTYLLPRIISIAMFMLSIKDLMLADVNPPIVIFRGHILPELILKPYPEAETRNTLIEMSKVDYLNFASELFGKTFDSIDEIRSFLIAECSSTGIRKLKDLHALMKNPEILIQKQQDMDDLFSLIRTKAIDERDKDPYIYQRLERYPHPGSAFIGMAFDEFIRGWFAGFNKLLHGCGTLVCHPLVEQGLQWNIMKWKFNRDNRTTTGDHKPSKHACVLNALQLDNFKWLGNIPLDGIIKLRQAGELQDLRELFGREIAEIKNAREDEFEIVVNQINYNLKQAFQQHENQIHELNEKYIKQFELDVLSLLVSGSIGALATVVQPLGYLAGLLAGTGGFETVNDLLEKRSELKKLNQKPLGLLFEAHTKQTEC